MIRDGVSPWSLVWLPSVAQEVFIPNEGAIECGLVSGLCVRHLHKPHGRYGDQRIGSQSTFRAYWLYVSNWFRRSRSIDHAPIRVVDFSHLLTEIGYGRAVAS